MKIGITFDLKSDAPLEPGLPDDFQEEFDSPVTIEAIAAVLRQAGHEVVKLGDGPQMLARLLADPPDLVFNLAEGQGIARSREARVPAVLEMLDIPYTGSDPLTLAVTLDKDCARRLASSDGVLCPRGVLLRPGDDPARVFQNHPQAPAFPVILKPAWEGSSKGIYRKCLVDGLAELVEVVRSLWRDQRQPILAEEFISGAELTVGVLGNDSPRILGIMQVHPVQEGDRFIYSLEVKRDYRNQVRYEVPAPLPAEQRQAVEQAALQAYRALGCRDVSRVDFRLRQGKPYFLEVNPLPGLNPETSDLVILARLAGLSYDELIYGILQAALDRHGLQPGLCRAAS